MRYRLTALLLAAALMLPLSASAFWFWDKPAEKADPAETAPEMDQAAQARLAARYKLWSDGFEKEDVDAVIAHQDDFWFSAAELNSLFASETKKQKNPVLTDFRLTAEGDSFDISANFRQIFPGRFSFTAKVVDEGGQARLSLSKVRLYGWPIPAAWFNKPLNKAIDDYFSFLYEDERFEGFIFSAADGVLKLKPEFK